MKPPHKLFFSSLKQVEKRLKLDDGNTAPPPPPPPPPLPPTTETQSTESLDSSPIYFHNQTTNASSTLQDNNSTGQPPQEFLSYYDTDDFQSHATKKSHQFHDSVNNFSETSTSDDIASLIQLLRLSDFDGRGPEMADVGDDEFYDKIVKVKGPKSKKEAERLDGWIRYLLNNGGCEPLRLGHLLLAKCAFVSVGSGDDGLEFPSTIDEFLQNDPPSLDQANMGLN